MPPYQRSRRVRHRSKRPPVRPLRVVSWVLVVAMLGIGTRLLVSFGTFEWTSHTVGNDLEAHIQSVIAKGATSSTVCASNGGGPVAQLDGFSLAGNLVAPSIALKAPVVEGVGNSQLEVAVGHDPASVWPSTHGTSVLSAHDVTWFSDLDHLQPGAELEYQTACRRYEYIVISSRVVKAGTPLATGSAGRLVLVTCYPLNALYLTPNRLVVEAELVSVRYRPAPFSQPIAFAIPTVPAPAPLAHQGLDIAHNAVHLGSLDIVGSPSAAWQQSDAPLGTHLALLALYLGAVRSAEQNQPSWWAALAPTVPLSAAKALVGTAPASSDGVDATITVRGSQVAGGTITGTLLVPGRSGGTYHVQMAATVDGGAFAISSFGLSPA